MIYFLLFLCKLLLFLLQSAYKVYKSNVKLRKSLPENIRFRDIMADLEKYAGDVLDELIDETILGVCFENHRSLKLGILFLDESQPSEDEEKYKIVNEPGLDIFGQPFNGNKKPLECECPNCHRNMAAIRFAPHLEKCMGMGRNSSRIASQRIANSGKAAAGLGESLCNDDDPEFASDADWLSVYETTSRRNPKRRRGERLNNGNSPKMRPGSRNKNNTPHSTGSQGSKNDTDFNQNLENAIQYNSSSDYSLSSVDSGLPTWDGHNITGKASPSIAKKKVKPSKYHSNKKSKKRHPVNY